MDAFFVISIDFWSYTKENDKKIGKVGLGIKMIEASNDKIMWKAGHPYFFQAHPVIGVVKTGTTHAENYRMGRARFVDSRPSLNITDVMLPCAASV